MKTAQKAMLLTQNREENGHIDVDVLRCIWKGLYENELKR